MVHAVRGTGAHRLSARPLPPLTRLARGSGASLISVGGAGLAHVAAGHHAPHWVVVLLALAVSTPLGVALTSVRHSRVRLATAVLLSQAVLHGLYALFPAHSGPGTSLSTGAASGGGLAGAHPGDRGDLTLLAAGELQASPHGTHVSVMPDASMAAAHLLAAVITYALLRRGEILMTSLRELLDVARVLLLVVVAPLVPVRTVRRMPLTFDRPRLADQWSGRSSRTLRGPPALTA
ncbi:hypothetical protein GCM10009674_30970 [Nesterenkonia xinjiangensis]